MQETEQNNPGNESVLAPATGEIDEDGVSLEEKENRVSELRKAGFTYARIAEEVGYNQASGAQRALKRFIARTEPEPDDHVRYLELERLDRLQVAIWPRAMKGDNQAINTVIRIMERRASYLNIEVAKTIKAEVVNYDGNRDIDGDIERIVNLIRGVDLGEPLEVEGGTSESGTVATEGGLEDLALHGGERSGQDENGGGVVSVGSDQQPEDSLGDSSPNIR
jgi:hypothetical protein